MRVDLLGMSYRHAFEPVGADAASWWVPAKPLKTMNQQERWAYVNTLLSHWGPKAEAAIASLKNTGDAAGNAAAAQIEAMIKAQKSQQTLMLVGGAALALMVLMSFMRGRRRV